MAQPPTSAVMARELVRSVPFITPFVYIDTLAAGGTVSAEFDTVGGFADPNLYKQTGAYPGTNTAKIHAIGPWLDAAVYANLAASLLVEYSIDRGDAYHYIAPATAIPVQTLINISGLRITGRFVRLTLTNTGGAPNAVSFGVYVRSA